MEISTVSLSSSIPRLRFSSSNSLFFNPNSILFSKPRPGSSSSSLTLNRTGSKIEWPIKKGLSCTCLFGLGVPELVVIAGVAALVFGPKKLPEIGKSVGKTVKSFQQAAREFESELKKEPDSLPEPTEEKPAALDKEEKENADVSSSKESL